MEITTIGRGVGKYIPDEVQISLVFQSRSSDYQTVLTEGNKSIDEFVNEVLVSLGFNNNDLKINNLTVREEWKYNNQTGNNELVGYLFESDALLEFPYDKDLIALFLNSFSKLTDPPHFTLNFGLKNEEQYKNELLQKAYQDALNNAEVIAKSANKQIKEPLKVSFEPLNQPFNSLSSFESRNILYSNENNINSFVNYLNPMDIEVEETLYALFLAE